MQLIGFEAVEFRSGKRVRMAPRPQRACAKLLDLTVSAIGALLVATLLDSPIDAWLLEQGYIALPGWTLIWCGLALAMNIVGDMLGLIAGFGSLGKLSFGLRVVAIDSGEKPMSRHALLRAVVPTCVTIGVSVACSIPFLWAVVIGWMIFLVFGIWMLWILSLSIQWFLLSKDTRRGIHDRAARTIVISSNQSSRGSWLMSIWR